MKTLIGFAIASAIASLSFSAGLKLGRIFANVRDFMEGWSQGFDDGMAFARRNRDRIDHYKGKGVWE